MRSVFLMVAVVVVAGICARDSFEVMLAPAPTASPMIAEGPYTRSPSKLWVSDRDDPTRSDRRSSNLWVSERDHSTSSLRRGISRTRSRSMPTYGPLNPYAN